MGSYYNQSVCTSLDFNDCFPPQAERAFLVSSIVLFSLSLLGCTLILVSYLLFPKLRNLPFKLVCYVQISDIGSGIGFLLGNPRDTGVCTLQSYVMSFFPVASVCWVSVIAFHVRLCVHNPYLAGDDETRYHRYYLAFAWGVPTVLTVFPQFWNVYGHAGFWCWIDTSTTAGSVWQFLQYYVPVYLSVVYVCVVYFSLFRTLRELSRPRAETCDGSNYVKMTEGGIRLSDGTAEPSLRAKRIIRKLWMYPAILIFCEGLWGSALRFQELVHPHSPDFVLIVLARSFWALQGLFNSLAYGFSSPVREEFKNKFCSSTKHIDEDTDDSRQRDSSSTTASNNSHDDQDV